MHRRLILLCSFLFLLFPIGTRAQVSGRLTGLVLDSSGAAIAGATVNILFQDGASPLLTATTTNEGLFSLAGVKPGTYNLSVSRQGFDDVTMRGVEVDPGRGTAVPTIRLEPASAATAVNVNAAVQTVQTANAEIASTVSNEQLRSLPLLNRDPLQLILTQPGVTQGRGNTVIDGQRTSFSNVTLDGINIQDNFIRSNGLNFQPNQLLLDQVAEFTVASSNINAAASGGASQVSFVTPSGTNEFHGAVYWYNRNNALAANTWFNNKDGIQKPFLNQNQAGGSLGGPIAKDKLFFYLNYELFRLRQQTPLDRTILTSDARNGIFTYRDNSGNIQKRNVLQMAGVQMDPAIQQILQQVPGPERINNFRVGDSSGSLLRNTAGYAFNARNNRTRDNVTSKLDYVLSTRNDFTASLVWNRDIIDRNDFGIANDYSVIPKVQNDNAAKLLSGAWRWNPSPSITNEIRGGFNLAPAVFDTSQNFGPYIVDGFVFDNPVNTFRGQGRDTNTYMLADNATCVRGKHTIQFGFQTQQIRTAPYNGAGITPTYSVGVGMGNGGLTGQDLPGISSSDLNAANNLLASLAGYVEGYTQTFNVTSRTSGLVNGATNRRHFSLNNYAGYVQDRWKLHPRLTLNLGLRYEYYTVLNEQDSLILLPVIQNNNFINTLLSNSTLDFAGDSVGRPFYQPDRNNFAPNLGLAWDLFGDGKTALRAGYSINYVNDETIAAIRNILDANSGLAAVSERSGLRGRISSSLPSVSVPAYKVPRTFADNFANNSQASFGLPDPNLRTPYVQQWSFGIQHDIKGTIVEARYVGNHGTKEFRAFDYNQVNVNAGGFLPDFLRAYNNGHLARAATGTFNAAYTGPGTQPLTVFPQLPGGGLLTNPTVSGLIERGEVGQLAAVYQVNGLNGSIDFFPNPYGLAMNTIANYSNSSYNALQLDVRRRTRSGLQFQFNYSYSKVLSDALGDGQTRFEPFLDMNNPKIERVRAPYDLTHVFRGNAVYELPMGRGRALSYGPLDRLLSGWSVSGLFTWESGTPFSIFSTRGTLNRSARSGENTADATLNKSQLDQMVGYFMTGNGPYFVSPSAIGPDGRGVAPDGSAPFQGQIFLNPGPGTIGGLQRRMFSGPWNFGMDFGIRKSTRITDRQSVELRMESTNLFNHPTFYVGNESTNNTNFNINQPTFGQITSTFYDRRVIQFGLYYRF